METYIALKQTKHAHAMRIDGAANPTVVRSVVRSIASSVGPGFLPKVGGTIRQRPSAEGYVVYRNAVDESKQVVFYLSNLKTRSKAGNMEALRVDDLELTNRDWDIVANEN